MNEVQAKFVKSYLETHTHDMDSQELEDLKKCYAQRWVETVDLSVLMNIARQHILKEVEDFDLQQVIEVIQDFEVDIDFKENQ